MIMFSAFKNNWENQKNKIEGKPILNIGNWFYIIVVTLNSLNWIFVENWSIHFYISIY